MQQIFLHCINDNGYINLDPILVGARIQLFYVLGADDGSAIVIPVLPPPSKEIKEYFRIQYLWLVLRFWFNKRYKQMILSYFA